MPSNALLRRWNAQNAAQSAIIVLSSGQRKNQVPVRISSGPRTANATRGSDTNVPNVSASSIPARAGRMMRAAVGRDIQLASYRIAMAQSAATGIQMATHATRAGVSEVT